MKKKLLAFVLCFVMVLSVLPMGVFAAESEGITYIDRTWDDANKQVVETEKECTVYKTLTGSEYAFGGGQWYVVDKNVTFNSRINLNGGIANFILCDGCTLNATKGIAVAPGSTLNIYGQTDCTGSLRAESTNDNAAIGGSTVEPLENGGNVHIYGGNITAKATTGAGIGGAKGYDGGNVIINGGTVTAYSENGKAIGAGYNGSSNGSLSVIEGAFIKAGDSVPGTEVTLDDYLNNDYKYISVSNSNALGLYIDRTWDDANKQVIDNKKRCSAYTFVNDSTGTFENGKWYVVTADTKIYNGITVVGEANLVLCDDCTLTVINGIRVSSGNTLNIYGQAKDSGALSALSTTNAAGIGGNNTDGGNVNIHGGKVTTVGGYYGAGIGGGLNGNGGNVAIYGGIVNAASGNNAAGIGGGSGGNGGNVNIYGGTVNASGNASIAVGAGKDGSSDGSLSVADGLLIKAGNSAAGTKVTLEDYLNNKYKYITIYTAEDEDWYIDEDYTLHITGKVVNNSTASDNTPWKEYKSQIKKVVCEEGASVTNGAYLFANCTNLKSIDIAKLGTDGVADAQSAFAGCESLNKITVSHEALQFFAAPMVAVSAYWKNTADGNTITGADGLRALNGTVTLEKKILVSYLDRIWTGDAVSEQEQVVFVDEVITDAITTLEDGKWYAVRSDVTNNNRIYVNGTANLILCDGCTLTLTKGICVSDDNALNLYGQSGDSGVLAASGDENSAAIGGGSNGNGGIVTVNGGTVSATAIKGAAIGGGSNGNGGIVTVNGGTVTATSVHGAGIGAGEWIISSDGRITFDGGTTIVNGGTVTAFSTYSVAIGAGDSRAYSGTLTVADGMAIKAGNEAPGTRVTVDEYIQNGYKYAAIEVNILVKGENWYIDGGTLHITGEVTNTSTTTDYTPWKEYKEQITAVVAEDGAKVTNCDRLFSNCTNLTTVYIAKLDITGTTNMRYMFSGCLALESLDLSTLDTSAVTSMMCMFYNASGLKTLNLDGWNTVNLTDMQFMFNNCASLTELDLGGFITDKVTSMYTTFYKCSALEKLNISSFSGENLSNIDFVLTSCPALAEIVVNGSILQKLADPVSQLSSVWYCKDTHQKYTTADELMTVTGKATLNKTVENIAEGESWYLDGLGCLHITGLIEGFAYDPDWYNYREEIYSVKAEEGSELRYDPSHLFIGETNLTTVDLHLANVEYLKPQLMFTDCDKLESVNVSGWSSSSIMYIENMFVNCPALAVVDMSNSDLSFLIPYQGSVFADCGALREIRIDSALMKFAADHLMSVSPSWKNAEDGTVYKSVDDLMAITGTVTLIRVCDHVWAEAACMAPKTCTLCGLTEGGADANAHNWAAATCADPKICTLCGIRSGEKDPDNHVWGKTADKAVKVCEHCGFIQGDGWYIPDGTTLYIVGDIHNGDNSIPWYQYKNDITTVKTLDGAKIESGYRLFRDFANLTEIDLSHLDTSDCATMESMFSSCKKLAKLDLSALDTSNVTNMSYMFRWCETLADLNISGFMTGKVDTMESMFEYCEAITDLDISHFDFASLKTAESMFSGCHLLANLDLGTFRAAKITNTRYMFSSCRALTKIDLSGLNTANVTNMGAMFQGCEVLTELDVSRFDTSSVTDMTFMFDCCYALKELDLSNFDTSSVTGMALMFRDCTALKKLDISSFNCDNLGNAYKAFDGCTALEEIKANGSALQKFAEPLVSAGIVPVWYNDVTTEKYQTTDDLKAIEGKVTLVQSVPFLFDSISLVLSGELGLNFYTVVNDVEAVKDGYMLFEIGSSAEQTVNFSDAKLCDDGRCVFTCNVNALQMADTITVTFHFGDTVVGPRTITVAGYIDKVIAKHNNDDTDPTVKLAKAIVNYGHYAQLAQEETRGFAIGTDYAETTNLSDVAIANAEDLVQYKATKTGNIDGITNISRSLSLDHGTDINLYFTVADDYVPTVTVTDKNGNTVDFTLEKQADGRYLLVIPQIAAHQLGDMYTVTVDGTMTINVSALSYAYSVLASGKTDAQKQAVSALYEYYKATAAYKSEQGEESTTERKNIEAEVIQIISNQLEIDESRIHLDSNLTLDLGVDEEDMKDILRELQEVFGVDFSEKMIASFITVEDIIRQINSL